MNTYERVGLKAMRLLLSTAFLVGLSVEAHAATPCLSPESGAKVVTSHISFEFTRDWNDMRDDLLALRRVAEEKDNNKFSGVVTELQQSLRAIQSYVPARQGRVCRAFVDANREFATIGSQLSEAAAASDWSAASSVATKLTKVSDKLRKGLPTSWFVRHRDGRRYH